MSVPGAEGASYAPAVNAGIAPGGAITVPDAVFLLTAEFKRHGHDLHLTGKGASGKEGGSVVLDGYFATPHPADLATARGAAISGETVKILAGPLAPAQYAQAGAGVAGAQPIGKVTATTGDVRVIHANGLEEPGIVNTPIFINDVLVTAANSSVGVAFVDKTTFALGAGARMVIDKFVHGGPDNGALFSVVQGAFSFVSGAVAHAKPDAMQVKLPTLTIGIRGTKVAGFAATEGGLSHAIERTYRSWSEGRERGLATITYVETRAVPEVGGRVCHIVRKETAKPELDPFVMSEKQPDPTTRPADAFSKVEVMLDAETGLQVGSVIRRADGELVASYFFRDVQLNPSFDKDQFKPAALKK